MIENARKSALSDMYTKIKNVPSTSFSALRITKVPRHHSLKNRHRRQSSKTIHPTGIIHISLRTTAKIHNVNHKPISTIRNTHKEQSKEIPFDKEPVTRSEITTRSFSVPKTHQHNRSLNQSSSNKWDNDNVKENSPVQNSCSGKSTRKLNNDAEYSFDLFSSFKKQPSQRAKHAGFQNIICDIHSNIMHSHGMSSKRIVYINERDQNSNTKNLRKRKSLDGCRCSCLCIIISLLVALIIGAAVTGTAVGLSMAQKTTTTIATITTTVTILTTTETTSTTSTMTTASTTTPYSCGNMTVLLNTDFIGFDISSSGSQTWTSCCALCLANIACRSFTYLIPATVCFLKTTPSNNGSYSTSHMSAKY